jgi:hypothetical protein
MSSIDLFYQGEGLREIQHLEIEPDATFAIVKARLAGRHGLSTEVLLIFIEDEDEPLDDQRCVQDHAGPTGLKLHAHRCHHVEVTVTFNNETVEHCFRPGATIAKVKRWAAEHKFGMTEEEAGEHVLQIAGTHERPAPGDHIGGLTACPNCKLAFDLVPDERVNGASKVQE